MEHEFLQTIRQCVRAFSSTSRAQGHGASMKQSIISKTGITPNAASYNRVRNLQNKMNFEWEKDVLSKKGVDYPVNVVNMFVGTFVVFLTSIPLYTRFSEILPRKPT